MRVLMFAESLDGRGGVQISTLENAQHLVNAGHVVALIHGSDGDLTPRWTRVAPVRMTIGSVQLPRRRPFWSLRRFAASWRYARRMRADVAYCHSMNQLPLASWVARAVRIPLVLHLRTPPPVDSRRNRRRLEHANRFIAVSTATRNAWSALDERIRRRCVVIPNGIDLEHFSVASADERMAAREALGLPFRARVVTYVGRLTPDKGVADLIEAHRRVPPDLNVTLVVAGSAASRADVDYEQRLKARALAQTIFLGHRSDVTTLMAAADVVVLPTHAEAFGRVVIEGLARGIPVLAADVGGVTEIMRPDLTDLLFPPGDVRRLADLIVERLTSSQETDARRCRAVAERYDLHACQQQIERVLHEVTAA